MTIISKVKFNLPRYPNFSQHPPSICSKKTSAYKHYSVEFAKFVDFLNSMNDTNYKINHIRMVIKTTHRDQYVKIYGIRRIHKSCNKLSYDDTDNRVLMIDHHKGLLHMNSKVRSLLPCDMYKLQECLTDFKHQYPHHQDRRHQQI